MQLRVLPYSVHDAHGAGFLVEGILWGTDFSLAGRVVEIGQRDWRLQHAATGVSVEQEGAEFVPKPQASVPGPLHGLDVEVRSGQHAVFGEMVGDRERNVFIRVVQLNKREHGNITGPAEPGFKVGADGIDTQVEVG